MNNKGRLSRIIAESIMIDLSERNGQRDWSDISDPIVLMIRNEWENRILKLLYAHEEKTE